MSGLCRHFLFRIVRNGQFGRTFKRNEMLHIPRSNIPCCPVWRICVLLYISLLAIGYWTQLSRKVLHKIRTVLYWDYNYVDVSRHAKNLQYVFLNWLLQIYLKMGKGKLF